MKNKAGIIDVNNGNDADIRHDDHISNHIMCLQSEGYRVIPPFFSSAEYRAINNSGIDRAFHRYKLDFGPVFMVTRHGRVKKCFTRKTAIRNLAHMMTTKVFRSSGIEIRFPFETVGQQFDGTTIGEGNINPDYRHAHRRCVRRLKLILARRKQFDVWMEKYNNWIDQYCNLLASKPI
ncbi:hypothetical protein KQL69_004903 [Escherichia coli]|nr:hypothetical protein [Escherichia coli]EHP9641251.1 hypothetical protein [Escherichia coli]EHP9646894.1 hypothetical protein [Escherichia coli]EHP9665611.1 hypothetical protein [Escherichia coli]EHP9687069.1 hypothetical protein [Escherichia coli]